MTSSPGSKSPCPKCGNSELREAGSGTRVLRCYDCRGMWLSPDEAERLAIQGTFLDPESMLPTKADEATSGRTGACPRGHGIMIRARVDLDEAFYLEQCQHCMGIWFDDGEWIKLASSHLVHHIRDLWDPNWQREMRNQRAEAAHREKLVEAVGEDAIRSLESIADRLSGHPMRQAVLAYFANKSE